MPANSRPQLLLYAALTLVIALLGARALRADGVAGPAPPAAVVEGAKASGAPDGASAAGEAAPAGTTPPTQSGAVAGAPPDTAGQAVGGTGAATRAGSATPARAAGGGPEILVHVAGAVRRPGVYRMPAGARVQDAVTSAGGARATADVHRLNLAAKVADGQQILIPRRGQRTSPAKAPASPSAGAPSVGSAGPSTTLGEGVSGGSGERIDLNSATVAQLETLDGVGPAIAQKIVDWREANGGFRSVDDLAQVAGIGPKKLEAMRPRVGV